MSLWSSAHARASEASEAGLPPCPLETAPPADGACDPLAFSNGNRIRRDDGTFIDPRSHEGLQIERILARQRRDREENAAQEEFFRRLTGAANAAEAERILQEAREKGHGVGTPNRIVYGGSKDAETPAFERAAQGSAETEPSPRARPRPEEGSPEPARAAPDESYRFPDGRLYSRKDGTLLRPDDPESSPIIEMIADFRARAEPEEEPSSNSSAAKAPKSRRPETAAERAKVWKKVRGNPDYTFSNGNQIRRKGGEPIRTDSAEGKQIQAILDRQRRDREANRAQKDLFWKMTRAKDAFEALSILKEAKAKDPNAGTPNTVLRKKK
ncbi:MAG: hypothetical protein HY553_12095 [Elusimicrobia bacterium]|nr:hypothetical protein [Elusimicrobiota bacterium]